MPFDDDSAVNCRECIGGAFRECLVIEALPATPTSIAGRDGKGEHPHGYSVHGSHLLGRCHGRLKATSPMITPQPFSPPRRYDSRQALAEWLPPAASVLCTYVADWTATKLRWGLAADESEHAALEKLAGDCPDTRISYEMAP
jgi:hypothetical protein